MKYLKKYATKAEYDSDYYGGVLPFPHVCLVGTEVIYAEQFESESDERTPLYVEAIEDLTVSFSTNAIEYSLDNEVWEELPIGTPTPVILAGNKAYFRASGLTASSSVGIGTFSISGQCNVGGNIMSMAYGEDYIGQTNLTQLYAFYRLFRNNIGIVSAQRLILPAMRLANYCYSNMFYGCASLVNAPAVLPALYAFANCYTYMFYNCTSLVNTPAIHLRTTTQQCCYYMFAKCTSLVNAPELPAGNAETSCYAYMFYGCASLVNAPAVLPAMVASSSCYQYMFDDCSSLVNAPALPATTLYSSCYQYMFRNCSSLVNAPALPATTLSSSCYDAMFYGCSSLVNAPALPATTLSSSAYKTMFYNCSSLRYIKAMFTSAPTTTNMSTWVSGVAPVGTFVKNSAATWEDTFGNSAIPTGWTVELADE